LHLYILEVVNEYVLLVLLTIVDSEVWKSVCEQMPCPPVTHWSN
jgi:hypothetical protein